MILVSACLAGLEVRYNGTHCLHDKINQLIKEGDAITVCPELLGGLSTPREPAEIVGGTGEDVLDGKASVIDKAGNNVTESFIIGSYETLKKALELKAKLIVLKENSPSCGSSMIYSGDFNGKKVAGNGVTAALLRRNGIRVVSEEEFTWDLNKG
nr:DUF523 domain-containing protein [Neobacillus sp. Marseille-Q6967]